MSGSWRIIGKVLFRVARGGNTLRRLRRQKSMLLRTASGVALMIETVGKSTNIIVRCHKFPIALIVIWMKCASCALL